MTGYQRRFIVYSEDEWTGAEIIKQVIYATTYTEAKGLCNHKYLAPEYMSPYKLKQQD